MEVKDDKRIVRGPGLLGDDAPALGDAGREGSEAYDFEGVGADDVGEWGGCTSKPKPGDDSLRRNSTHRCENDCI